MAIPVIATGRWLEIPNTRFRDFAIATNIPDFLPDGGDTGRAGIFVAWNSGLVDRSRQRWVSLRGGGHNDNAHNGVYAWSWNTLLWSTLRASNTSRAVNYGDPGYPPLVGNETNNLLSPSRIRVHSNDATDTRTVTVNGQDTTGAVTSETLQINGTTPVVGTITFRWLLSITMSGPNIGTSRRALFRREDNTTGVWPTSTSSFAASTATGVTRFGGPFNLTFAAPQMKGASAYYAATPTQESLTEPSSVHTYDSIEHLVSHDVYYSGGGIYFGFGENTPNTVWIFNPNNGTWSLPSPGSATRPGGGTSGSVWDPVVNLLWARVGGAIHTYNYPTNTWTLRVTNADFGTLTGKLVIDAPNRLVYFVRPNSGSVITIYRLNVANLAAITTTPIVPTGSIDIRNLVQNASFEGIGAVFVGGRIAVYGRDTAATRGVVYSVDPDSPAPVWTIHEPDNAIKPPIPTGYGSTWNKFFSPDDIHLVYIHTETENVWAYKIPWSTATPFRPIGLQTVLK